MSNYQFLDFSGLIIFFNNLKNLFANINHTHTLSEISDFRNQFQTLMQDYGNLPSEYTRCDYIESNGTQYIQTNIVPNQDTRVIIDFEPTSVSSPAPIFGARIDVTENAFGLWVENIEDKEDHVHVCPQYGSIGYAEYHILMNPVNRLFIDMHSTGAIVNENSSTWERTTFSTES